MLRRHARAWPGLAGDWLKDVHVLAVRVPVYRTAEFLKALKQVVRGKPKAACVDAAVELARWLSAGRSRYPSTANCDRSS